MSVRLVQPIVDARSARGPCAREAAAAPPGERVGFTLVELLIVVATVALLVAILAPALARAKDIARQVLCQNRLHQWGQAFCLYAAQNDSFFPHTDGLDRDNGPADRVGWVDVVPPVFDERPWRDHPLFERPGVDTIFQCPAGRLSDARYGYRPNRDGFFSFAMNSCLVLDENCYRAAGDGGVPMPSFLNTDLIVAPPRVVLLFDQLLDPARGYGGSRPNRTAGKYCGGYPRDFAVRHRKGAAAGGGSILYCDYHVGWTESVWKDDWPAKMNAPPRDDPDWFPYPK